MGRLSTYLIRWAMIVVMTISINASVVGAQSPRATITASAVSSVLVDGVISRGEWPSTRALSFDQGGITVTRDALRLYMLVNVSGDTNSQTGASEYASVSFDVNKDGRITPNVDVRFTLLASGVMCKQKYTSASALSTCDTTNVVKSSGVSAFNCFVGDESRTVAVSTYVTKCLAHRVYEFAFDLVEIGAMNSDGTSSTPRFGVEVSSLTPKFKVSLPAAINNAAEYTVVNLATVRLPGIGTGTLSFPTNPIEVTQAIQTVDNQIPLVARKETVVRVTVRSSATSQPAVVYLSAKRGGITLAGSPLSVIMTAKNAPNRHNLYDTANFLLPDSWTSTGTISLQASVAKVAGNIISSTSTSVRFNTRETPTYWIIPLNEGTEASPSIVSDTFIADNQSYFETVLPVPSVDYVRRPWSDLSVGNVTLDGAVALGVDYYHRIQLAWLLTTLFTGSEPFKLPEMVYIFTTTGGGLSSPTWWQSGEGRVAVGGNSVSREAIIAHEFNHNLDRNPEGSESFGRHVGGCGSEGPHASWPHGDLFINEVGFDTRLPWTTATSTRRTVIPNNDTWPDYMSYCQSGSLPTQWVAPFRYTSQYAVFAPGASRIDDTSRSASKTPALWVSGTINADGSGALSMIALEPESFAPTISSTVTGTHSIKVLDSAGAELATYGFTPNFTAHRDHTPTSQAFGYTIPNTTNAAKIELYNGSTLLESRAKSANSIVATFNNLTRGQVISRKTSVTWTATDADTTDSSLWRYDVFYSPDGLKWYPLKMNLRNKNFEFDPNTVQAGKAAKLRLVANDGYNVTRVDSPVITVAGGAPIVSVIQPVNAATYSASDFIPLNGDARSISTDGLSENNVFWFAKKVGTNISQLIGTSTQSIAKLSAGTYDITLVAKDANSKVNTKVVRIIVK